MGCSYSTLTTAFERNRRNLLASSQHPSNPFIHLSLYSSKALSSLLLLLILFSFSPPKHRIATNHRDFLSFNLNFFSLLFSLIYAFIMLLAMQFISMHNCKIILLTKFSLNKNFCFRRI